MPSSQHWKLASPLVPAELAPGGGVGKMQHNVDIWRTIMHGMCNSCVPMRNKREPDESIVRRPLSSPGAYCGRCPAHWDQISWPFAPPLGHPYQSCPCCIGPLRTKSAPVRSTSIFLLQHLLLSSVPPPSGHWPTSKPPP